MKVQVIKVALATVLLSIAGIGSAAALAGGQHATWSCKERPAEKHCKPDTTTTLTVTLPGTTVPGVPVTVTSPPVVQTVTVTTPAPPPVTTTLPAETVTVKVKVPAKGTSPVKKKAVKKPKKPAPRKGTKPRDQFHTGGGVTGACSAIAPCRKF